jgi:hypothetical protein
MWDVNNYLLSGIDRKIRRFNFDSKMETLRKLDHLFEYNKVNKNEVLSKNLFVDSRPTKWLKPHAVYPWEIEYLSIMSIINEEWDGFKKDLNKISDFRVLVNKYRNYNPPLLHIRDKEENSEKELFFRDKFDFFFIRTALQQLNLQNHPLKSLYRYNYFFNFENQKFNVKAIFKSVFGFPYKDYVYFSIALYALSWISNDNITVDRLLDQLGDGKLFSNEKIMELLNELSSNRREIKNIYYKMNSEDERMKIYNYNPLRMKPIIKEKEIIYLPMPQLLYKAVTEGFFHWLCDQSSIENFRIKFGKNTFEQYVNNILTWNSSYKIIPEFKYNVGKNELKSPDFMLIKNNEVILVEVKSTTPSIKLRYTDVEEYSKQLEKAYGKALIQCLKKEKHIKSQSLYHEKLPDKINHVYFLIITLENFHIPPSEFMKKNIREIVNREIKFSEDRDFHALGVEVLEELIEQDNRDIFQFLKQRENNGFTFKKFPSTEIKKEVSVDDTRVGKFYNSKYNEIQTIMFD